MEPSIHLRYDFFHLPQSVSSLQGWSASSPGLRGWGCHPHSAQTGFHVPWYPCGVSTGPSIIPEIMGLGLLPGPGHWRSVPRCPEGPSTEDMEPSAPDYRKKVPSWFLCPGVGTTGFQFVSRKSPFLGWEDGQQSKNFLGAEKGVCQGCFWVCLLDWSEYLSFSQEAPSRLLRAL